MVDTNILTDFSISLTALTQILQTPQPTTSIDCHLELPIDSSRSQHNGARMPHNSLISSHFTEKHRLLLRCQDLFFISFLHLEKNTVSFVEVAWCNLLIMPGLF